MEYHRCIIVGQCHVLAPQSCRMGACGQPKKIERSLAVLRFQGKRKQCEPGEKDDKSHLYCTIRAQRYEICR